MADDSNDDTLKELLLAEIESKKKFEANWDTECNGCWEAILEGDDFYFFPDKQKVCSNCYERMKDLI